MYPNINLVLLVISYRSLRVEPSQLNPGGLSLEYNQTFPSYFSEELEFSSVT